MSKELMLETFLRVLFHIRIVPSASSLRKMAVPAVASGGLGADGP